MKKWLLAVSLCVFALVSAVGCGKKEEKQVVSGPEDVTYDKLHEANLGSKLLEKYSSVQYELLSYSGSYDDDGNPVEDSEVWTIFKQDGEYVLTRVSEDGQSIVYADGTCYYESLADKNKPFYSQGWFMEGEYDDYMKTCIDDFLVDKESEEDFDSVEEKGDNYVILSYVGEGDGEKYYYRYTVDNKSLLLKKFEAVIIAEGGEERVVSHSDIETDKKTEIPKYVDELKKAEKKRLVTIHADDGDTEIKLPENVTLLAALNDGYGLFKDKDAKEAFDDTVTEADSSGVYPDVECYLIYTGEQED